MEKENSRYSGKLVISPNLRKNTEENELTALQSNLGIDVNKLIETLPNLSNYPKAQSLLVELIKALPHSDEQISSLKEKESSTTFESMKLIDIVRTNVKITMETNDKLKLSPSLQKMKLRNLQSNLGIDVDKLIEAVLKISNYPKAQILLNKLIEALPHSDEQFATLKQKMAQRAADLDNLTKAGTFLPGISPDRETEQRQTFAEMVAKL